MSATPSVICFGEALWDLTPAGPVPGGAPLNVAIHLNRNGIPARLLTRVGHDRRGRRLLDHLNAQGVDTGLVQVDPDHPTGCVQVDLSDPREPRFDIQTPAAWDFIDCGDDLAAAGVVFGSLASRRTVSRNSLMRLLDRCDLKVFDVNLRPPFDHRDTVERLLVRADWVKLNGEELRRIGGWIGLGGEPAGVAAGLARRYRLSGVCVTLGGEGAVMVQGDTVLRQPGFRVEVVDTVGCGDAFLGAWLAGVLADREPVGNLRRACAVAALVATRAGGGFGISEERIRALLATA